MEKIQGSKLILPLKEGKLDKRRRVIKNKMISLGLNEALSYALIPESVVHKYTTDEFTLTDGVDIELKADEIFDAILSASETARLPLVFNCLMYPSIVTFAAFFATSSSFMPSIDFSISP